jgi:hypothetical protein
MGKANFSHLVQQNIIIIIMFLILIIFKPLTPKLGAVASIFVFFISASKLYYLRVLNKKEIL